MEASGNSGQTQTDLALTLILKYIKDNGLKKGDRLPSERSMSEQFSVGRQALREAIKMLSMMNIVETRKQGGTFIAPFDSNSRYDQLRLFVQSGQISTSEIFQVRQIMEVECIALAVKNISEEQIERVRDAVTRADINNPEAFAEADRILHKTIYEAMNNRAMELLMQPVRMWAGVSQTITNTYIEVRQMVQNDHLQIVDALERRDEQACREAMSTHMQHLIQVHYVSDTLVREKLAELLEQ